MRAHVMNFTSLDRALVVLNNGDEMIQCWHLSVTSRLALYALHSYGTSVRVDGNGDVNIFLITLLTTKT